MRGRWLWTYSVGFEPAPVACVYFQECRLGSLAASKGSLTASKGSLAASKGSLAASYGSLAASPESPADSWALSAFSAALHNTKSSQFPDSRIMGPACLLSREAWSNFWGTKGYQQMVEPDLSHLTNLDPVLHCTCTNQYSGSGTGSRQTKTVAQKRKKARNLTFGRAFSVAKSALEVYELCNFLTANLFRFLY